MPATEEYTHLSDGVWHVGDTHVALYSVISMWLQGYAPEEIPASFPALTLQQTYGAILFYLERREELDAFFRRQDALFATQKAATESAHTQFYAELRARIARAHDIGVS